VFDGFPISAIFEEGLTEVGKHGEDFGLVGSRFHFVIWSGLHCLRHAKSNLLLQGVNIYL
jgi:hypothetical protein